ncbi:NAD(P)-dependent oxidoreductase [Bacteriovorax sp. Seq25_V]|uniref:NAD(P)-dependent oxidoreductase n=1 Tax=Bacteriovorax sp. Seq25_V TaxID=1201288 RepID=UPI00038A0A2D|nr:NAD(P)-dependent oxidoreductase [Bacteriovorax sp. Seq25_V]EQC46226.1 4-phosphoerythronate dehydrogenase [Bacteriovorax sp. Seq25_V]
MNTSGQFIIFRPEVSSYQDHHFREQEEKILLSLPELKNSKYISDYNIVQTEIKSNPNLQIIFISTSYTKIDLYQEIKNHITLWIHPNSGYDNLSKEFIEDAKFPIINGNVIRADAVFQYIIACFLDSQGAIPFSPNWDKSRTFKRSYIYRHHSLIVGLGHIGSKLASFFNLSGISYDIYDPYLAITPENQVHEIELSKYDSVILSCGLNKTSAHIINTNKLKSAKDSLVIINAARGGLIAERDLINFLARNQEAKAYLDVYENEPNDLSQFKGLANIKLTSHIAGVYENIDEQIIEFEKTAIKDGLTLKKAEFELKYKKAFLKNNIIDGILI